MMFNSCSFWNDDIKRDDDKLTIPKTPFTGNQLRIDGYYYSLFNNEINTIYVYFQNGVFQHFGVTKCGLDFDKAELYFSNANSLKVIKNNKYFWGVFLINGDNIKKEEWQPSSGAFPVYTSEGKILNDTTILFTQLYRLQNGQKTGLTTINETYYFRKFSPKPDSTNEFIK